MDISSRAPTTNCLPAIAASSQESSVSPSLKKLSASDGAAQNSGAKAKVSDR